MTLYAKLTIPWLYLHISFEDIGVNLLIHRFSCTDTRVVTRRGTAVRALQRSPQHQR